MFAIRTSISFYRRAILSQRSESTLRLCISPLVTVPAGGKDSLELGYLLVVRWQYIHCCNIQCCKKRYTMILGGGSAQEAIRLMANIRKCMGNLCNIQDMYWNAQCKCAVIHLTVFQFLMSFWWFSSDLSAIWAGSPLGDYILKGWKPH